MKIIITLLIFTVIIYPAISKPLPIKAQESLDISAQSFPWGTWNKYIGNPVLDDQDAKCIFPEVILSDASDPLRQPILIAHPITKVNYFWLYYDTCWRGGGRLAYSSDLIHWTPYEKNPVIASDTGEATLFIGNMFKDGNNFYIFYDIVGGIRYAKSSSPFGPWTKGPVILKPGALGTWEEGRVTESFVFKYSDTYYLYYMGDLVPPYGRKEQVGLATASSSAFPKGPWVKKGLKVPVTTSGWDSQIVADPSIIQVGNIWYMLYTGSGYDQRWRVSIAKASRPQGPWTKIGYPIINYGPSGSWDNDRLLRGSIHYYNGKYYLPYAGSDGNNFRVGLVKAKALVSTASASLTTDTE